eukprot:6103453-Pleurochrysis_carterae.AAC.3
MVFPPCVATTASRSIHPIPPRLDSCNPTFVLSPTHPAKPAAHLSWLPPLQASQLSQFSLSPFTPPNQFVASRKRSRHSSTSATTWAACSTSYETSCSRRSLSLSRKSRRRPACTLEDFHAR